MRPPCRIISDIEVVVRWTIYQRSGGVIPERANRKEGGVGIVNVWLEGGVGAVYLSRGAVVRYEVRRLSSFSQKV